MCACGGLEFGEFIDLGFRVIEERAKGVKRNSKEA